MVGVPALRSWLLYPQSLDSSVCLVEVQLRPCLGLERMEL